MKRLLLPLLLGALLCTVPVLPMQPKVSLHAAAAQEGYPFDTSCSYLYDGLDAPAQTLYNTLYAACTRIDDSDKTYTESDYLYYEDLTNDQVADTVLIFTYNHPEFFWVSNTYVGGSITRAGRTKQYVMLKVYDAYQDGAARQSAKQQIIDTAQDYIDTAMTYHTDYDRAGYLRQALRQDITYEFGDLDQSLASALLEKKTVCAGFTKAYTMLCNAVGVPAVSMTGVNHGWNAVQIAGVWYYVDVTNRLYLLSDEEMQAHDIALGTTYEVDDGENGTVVYRMHDIYYQYYEDIFPDCPQSYDNSYFILDGASAGEDDGYAYSFTSVSGMYEADDATLFTPEMLISSLTRSPVLDDGTLGEPETVEDLSCVQFIIAGWRSPEEAYASAKEGFYQGGIPCIIGGKRYLIGDTLIAQRGDPDLSGRVDANDAARVLLYSAQIGAKQQNVRIAADPSLEDVCLQLADVNGAGGINAQDASYILVYAARFGAGQHPQWCEILP
ncbi:MAG: hypothetical protein IJ055_05910 [Oscillospiraceae bacterium]|nr:hypothetical protein [Oscillospiraceae bacterium]